MATEFIRVYARVRPSRTGKTAVVSTNGKKIATKDHQFTFDGGFGAASRQEEIFEQVGKRIIDGAIDGINGTVFAYGQTGSGKTFTMVGPDNNGDFELDGESKGLVPRCIGTLFEKLEEEKSKKGDRLRYEVKCSFVEIYNEVIRDLLTPGQNNVNLRVLERVVLEGAANEVVTSELDAVRLLQAGLRQRQVGSTAMNDVSSRSHAIFIVDVVIEESEGSVESRRESRICLVDLAGSERQAVTQTAGKRLKEACGINKSLTTLALVIRKLSEGSAGHVPFRDSKLTLLLKESIGGSSRTAVIVALHADLEQERETLSTLAFANNVKKIKNTTTINKSICGESVAALKERIVALEALLDKERESARREKEAAEERYRLLEEQMNNVENFVTPRKKPRRKTAQHEASARKMAAQALLWDDMEVENANVLTEKTVPAEQVERVETALREKEAEIEEAQRMLKEERERSEAALKMKEAEIEAAQRMLKEERERSGAALKMKEVEHKKELKILKEARERAEAAKVKEVEYTAEIRMLKEARERSEAALQTKEAEYKEKLRMLTEAREGAEAVLKTKEAEYKEVVLQMKEMEETLEKQKETEKELKEDIATLSRTKGKIAYIQKLVDERDALRLELDKIKTAQKK